TREFALVQHARSDPPHQRMEPKDRFYYHVYGGEDIVSAAHVTHFVSENRTELLSIQMFQETSGKNQNGAKETNDSWFLRVGSDHRRYGNREFYGPASAQGRTNLQPSAASRQCDCKKSQCPHTCDCERHPTHPVVHGNIGLGSRRKRFRD